MTADNSMEGGREHRCRVLVVGVGGGACNVLGHALTDWPDPPAVAAVNTDARALAESGIGLKVMIGRNVTKGMGEYQALSFNEKKEKSIRNYEKTNAVHSGGFIFLLTLQ